MEIRSFSLDVSPTIGAVSAEYIIPPQPKCIMTLAHGAGAGMRANHAFKAGKKDIMQVLVNETYDWVWQQ